ncbi:hypothetical protein K2173_015552 [Erythroxylum novogranatense]|uniref:Chromo domain-containing protein n=1 Tax=Erythroxylum novogranatense TaxID=1862640 RepID=A0AAV8SED9_9ROSI|nr:hypothetical protein K2173_015552 [Erythroxylum novogranatense]
MAPYEALYGRRCRTPICWDEAGERKLVGPELVQMTVDKIDLIKQRLKAAQDRMKSYADTHRKEMEYAVGDKVFLKTSPWKGVMRRYRSDPSHIIQTSEVQLSDDLSYEEMPVAVLDSKEKVLRNKTIQLVKVLWRNHAVEEATWEPLDAMKEKYPHLFNEPGKNFEDEIS